jgi:hypothetical protein
VTRVSPAAVIQGAVSGSRGADPEQTTTAILQALKAHKLRIVADTANSKTPEYCTQHTSVQMPCQLPHDRSRT